MKEQLISFETAKLAKDKGYHIFVNYCYDINNHINSYSGKETYPLYLAPSQSLLQKWLREDHKIDITIHRSFSMTNSYHYCIIVDCDYETEDQQSCTPGRSYEEVLEQGLLEALKLIK